MRLKPIAISCLALGLAAQPLAAADFRHGSLLRQSFPNQWETSVENPLRFEAGLRYWYSLGSQSSRVGTQTLETDDQTHILELHTKIEDFSTQTYVRAHGGFGVQTSGDFSVNGGTRQDLGGQSRIGHAGADFGWLPLGNMREGFSAGGLVGYQYWKDAPDVGRRSFITGFDAAGNPNSGDSARSNLDIHALRLGVKAQADFGMFDIQAEAAAVPYAYITGTSVVPAFGNPAAGLFQGSAAQYEGRGYGAMGEAAIGFHPSENLTVRIGGRAWYLQATDLEARYELTSADTTQTPAVASRQGFVTPAEIASLFRYGAFVELTGRF